MWLKLEHLPEHITGCQMFVVISFDVLPYEGANSFYTTDPYCTWLDPEDLLEPGEYHFPRWPHPFKPTHFCLLPEGRE